MLIKHKQNIIIPLGNKFYTNKSSLLKASSFDYIIIVTHDKKLLLKLICNLKITFNTEHFRTMANNIFHISCNIHDRGSFIFNFWNW